MHFLKSITLTALWLLAASTLIAADFTPSADKKGALALQQQVSTLKDTLISATVGIERVGQPGAGSGVIVSADGLIMTAAHVTPEPGGKLLILMADGTVHPATTLGVDHTTDAALAQLDKPGPYPFVPHAKTATFQVGDWVIATGHPGGPIANRPPPLRLGRIWKAGSESGFTDPISSTCTVISGDSGGPLFDLDGKVIGIHSNVNHVWYGNNHVPLQSFLDHWDALLKGSLIEGNSDSDSMATVDDPLAPQRAQADQLIAEQAAAGNKKAQEYLRKPRLLYPYELQDIINQWGEAPLEEADTVAYLGTRFDLTQTTPTVASVVSGSPAARAGLQPGDQIKALNGTPYSDIAELISQLQALEVTTNSTLSIQRADSTLALSFQPEAKYARRSLSNDHTSALRSMLNPGSAPLAKRDRNDNFIQKAFQPFVENSHGSVVTVERASKTVAHALVVNAEGELLTKASELLSDNTLEHDKEKQQLRVRVGENTYAATIIGMDKKRDLALLQTDAPGLVPVRWSEQAVEAGTLIVTPTADAKLLANGVITQPLRECPKPELEHTVSLSAAPYLGVQFDPDFDTALVTFVEPSSPADIAGLREGDTILKLNGKKINSGSEFKSQLTKMTAGTKTRVKLKRDAETLTLRPILGTRGTRKHVSSKTGKARERSLHNLAKKGGKLSKRRADFPLCIYHDTILNPEQCGTPLLDLDGRTLGINISRSNRHRSLAIPYSEIKKALDKIRSTKQETQTN